MCPACISTTVIAVAAGATSAGGVLALLARKLQQLRRAISPPR
jgi:hypothetical protein